MPPIGKLMGGVNFTDLFINLDPSKKLAGDVAITQLVDGKVGVHVKMPRHIFKR